MIFFKHIYRSIKKSPLQPIIILLTLTLSVASLLTAVKLCINVVKESNVYKNVDNYICDITIKPSASDDVRLMFIEDAEEILGEDGVVHGEFNFTALITQFDNEDIIDVSAADLVKADEFYNFKFMQYGEFTEKNVNNSMLLSNDYARHYDIKVGDTITLLLLNERMDFTVQAIGVGEGYLYEVEAIINIDAVSAMIGKVNPAVSSFAGSIVPYTMLKIRINDPARIDEFIDKFAADERFADKTIVKESENIGSADFMQMVSMIVIAICAAIIAVLSAIVISTALELLNKKRIKESALFMLSGATTKQLNLLLYLECLVYSIISAFSGLIISTLINRKINVIFNWNTDNITFKLYDIPIVLIASPVIVLLTAFIHTSRAKKLSVSERIADNSENKATKASWAPSLISLALAIALLIPMLLVKTNYKCIFSIPLLIVIIIFTYTFVPIFMDSVSKLLIWALEKRKKVPPKSILVLKNASVSYPIKHTARLITVLMTLVCSVFVCILALTSELNEIQNLIDCDYISIDGNDKTAEVLENLEEVDDTFRFNIIHNIMTEQNTGVLAISVSDDAIDYLNPNIAPSKIPHGNEIVLSTGVAALGNTKVGDSISLLYETNAHTYTVTEIVKTSANIVFFDAETIGSMNKFLCIKTDAVKGTPEFQPIAALFETRGITTIDFDTVFDPVCERLFSYSNLAFLVSIIAVFTMLLGITNVLVASNISRKREREVYYTVGMSKSNIKKTMVLEILYVLIVSIILIPIITLATSVMLDIGFSSFGVDLLRF